MQSITTIKDFKNLIDSKNLMFFFAKNFIFFEKFFFGEKSRPIADGDPVVRDDDDPVWNIAISVHYWN